MKRILTLLALGLVTGSYAQVPQLLKDIHPANVGLPQAGASTYFVIINNKLFFNGNDGPTSGTEPWMTDGTLAGTQMIKDVVPGPNSSDVGGLPFFFNNKYFWLRDDGTTGAELFESDLTSAGTSLFMDLNAGSGGSYALKMFELNGSMFIRAMNASSEFILYKSNGTIANTVPLVPSNFYFASYYAPLVVGNTAYMAASDVPTANTDELYITDGTTAGTVLLKDINAGAAGSNPRYFTLIDNKVLFTADNGTNGEELWITDGTAAGTILVKDINPGATGSSPTGMKLWNGKVYFNANDGTNGQEVWVTDGTASGTMMLKDINTTGNGTAPGYAYFLELNGYLVFLANNGTNGIELWRTDGTEPGTTMIKDANPGAGHGFTEIGTTNPVNGKIYIRGTDGVHGNEVWYSDGTEPGTQMMYDLNPGAADGVQLSAYFGNLGDDVFFVGDDATTGWELYHFNAPVSVKELNSSDNNITVYPNPVKDVVTITLNGQVRDATISLYNSVGQVVTKSSLYTNTATIDMHSFVDGVYLLEVSSGSKVSRSKIIK